MKDEQLCWSLHALWDAEILKLITEDNIKTTFSECNESYFDLEDWCSLLNYYICKLYEYPENYSIEEYSRKYKYLSLYFVKMAAMNTASILNSRIVQSPRF